MPYRFLISAVFIFTSFSLSSQEKGLQFISDGIQEGYVLFESGQSAVIIDNCGREVHRWNNVLAKYHPKLLANGNLIYVDWFSDEVVERDWDGDVINTITVNDPGVYLDYEVIVLPNGNYLCLGRDIKSQQEFENLGFDFGIIGFPNRTDAIIEIDRNTGNVVWKWDIADHVIQERDPNLPNYGSVFDNPQLLNMDAISTFDWQEEFIMINGFDYNPELDQIVVSLRKLGEFAIIDHSTTTQEAAGHTGGNQGKGGDILYRWGNPANYGRGTEDDQVLFYQHNPNWIEYGEYTDHIIVYDNGFNRKGVSFSDRYSAARIIDTGASSTGSYEVPANDAFPPSVNTKEYSEPATGNQFYSSYTSSAEVMPDGNIFITVGDDERAFEITPEGEEVWRYGLPQISFFLFRSEKYAPDYPAFVGKDLTPGAVVEFPPSDYMCVSSVENQEWGNQVELFVGGQKQLNIVPSEAFDYQFNLLNSMGQLVKTHSLKGRQNVDLSQVVNGVYFVQLVNMQNEIYAKKIALFD